MKKGLAMGLILTMAVSALAGCNYGPETGTKATEKAESTGKDKVAEETTVKTESAKDTQKAAEKSGDSEAEAGKTLTPHEGEPVKVAYLTQSISNEVWQMMSQGVIKLGPEYGLDVTTMDCDGNAATQVEQIESCIEAGYECLVIAPSDPEALSEACKKAVEAGVHVVSLDGPDFNCQTYTAANEYDNAHQLGVMQAEWINENWPEKEEINLAVLEYVYENACITRAKGLIEGFQETIKAKVNIVAQESPHDAAEANSVAETILQGNKVDCVLSISGDMLYGFCLAAENAGISTDELVGSAMDISTMSAKSLAEGKYIKYLGSWGSPSYDKALVHIEAILESLKVEGLTDKPACVNYKVSASI